MFTIELSSDFAKSFVRLAKAFFALVVDFLIESSSFFIDLFETIFDVRNMRVVLVLEVLLVDFQFRFEFWLERKQCIIDSLAFWGDEFLSILYFAG